MTIMLESTPEGIGEAIQRCVKATLVGGYFHIGDTEKHDLNDEAIGPYNETK